MLNYHFQIGFQTPVGPVASEPPASNPWLFSGTGTLCSQGTWLAELLAAIPGRKSTKMTPETLTELFLLALPSQSTR